MNYSPIDHDCPELLLCSDVKRNVDSILEKVKMDPRMEISFITNCVDDTDSDELLNRTDEILKENQHMDAMALMGKIKCLHRALDGFSERFGNWIKEEEELLMYMIDSYFYGAIVLQENKSLRDLLHDTLHCSPARITKKLTRKALVIGHTKNKNFVPKAAPRPVISKVKYALSVLEYQFLVRVYKQEIIQQKIMHQIYNN